MDFSPETLPPSTVVDCMGMTPDSLDSFYTSTSDSTISKHSHNLTDFSGSAANQLPNKGGVNRSLSLDDWLEAEGIVDIQQVLLNNQVQSPSVVNAMHADVNTMMGSESADSEDENISESERLEIKEIMALPAKNLNAAQKKIRRRELNRLAARRSRGKKRAATKALAQEVSSLCKKNANLRTTLEALLKEKEIYLTAIKHHFKHQPPAPINMVAQQVVVGGQGD